jgi:predicted glycosyltransferase
LISGPEPQRSIFEKKCLSELKDFNGKAALVRGLPLEKTHLENFGNVSFFNHLPADELGEILGSAKFVVSRSGYSTVMDMVALKKKSIFIPTPGQTEQEYLAEYLMEKKFCFAIKQKDFSLRDALTRAANFEYADFSQYSMSQIDAIVKDCMNGLLKETELPDVSDEI